MKAKKINIKSRFFSYFMIFGGALLFTIGTQAFMQNAKTFSSGLGAIVAVPTFIIKGALPYFSLIYIACNIPLLIFSWYKNDKKFTLRTSFFIVAQAIFGSIFLIPNVKESFIDILNHKRSDEWPILVLSIIGAVLIALSMVMSFKWGGSTGGTDIIVFYFSSKKEKSIGYITSFFSTTILIFSFCTVISIDSEMRKYWLITIISSIVYVLITAGLLDKIYPRYKKIEVVVVSSKMRKIQSLLRNSYVHAWRIEKFDSGLNGNQKEAVKTVMYLLELKDFIRAIKEVDSKVWVSSSYIKSIHGQFSKPKN